MSASAGPRAAADRSGRTVAVTRAVRRAGRFDRAQISARAGVIAAIPVAGMLALGTALGSPTAAVTMGVGAMLTGVAWRAGDGPLVPPLGTMAGAAVALGVSTLAGTLSGHWAWLHLLVLVIFCLLAGSAASLGRRGIVTGTQSIIAFIVFGRFPLSVPHALALTGLVLAGGGAQVLFAAVVATPLARRHERAAPAAAFRALADFTAQVGPSSLPAAAALDDAESALAAPALLADPARDALSGLVSQGRRIRLELIALSTLLAQLRRTSPDLSEALAGEVDAALARVRQLLVLTVAAIDGDTATLAALPAEAADVSEWGATREPLASPALEERMSALIGQVTAAARMAAALPAPARSGLTIPVGRPSLGVRLIARQLVADARRMRTATTLHTAPGRHAVRLAVVVALTELLVQRVALPRAYWAVVAASTVLRPDFGQTFTRGVERVLGTIAGVVVATLIAVAIDPSGWGVVAVVAALAWCTYAVFPASFAAGIAMLTGVVVFLLHAVAPDTAQTALDRGIDTAIGGTIGLIAYALWPTWSALSTGPLLARLADAQHVYLDAVLGGLTTGRRMPETQLRTLARDARLASADADAAIGLARSEPARRGQADVSVAAAVLATMRRVVYGVHVLRLDIAAMPDRGPVPLLAPLQAGLGEALTVLAEVERDSEPQPFPGLRRLHRELVRAHPEMLSHAVWAALDELIDAIDTAAATVGLTVP